MLLFAGDPLNFVVETRGEVNKLMYYIGAICALAALVIVITLVVVIVVCKKLVEIQSLYFI